MHNSLKAERCRTNCRVVGLNWQVVSRNSLTFALPEASRPDQRALRPALFARAGFNKDLSLLGQNNRFSYWVPTGAGLFSVSQNGVLVSTCNS